MGRKGGVPRPTKKTEYEIRHATREAEVGWRDLAATQRNALADAWDYLTKTPGLEHPNNHPLRGELGTIRRDGREHTRWQHKLHGGARIWFYVEDRTVWLERVHTRHPNETK